MKKIPLKYLPVMGIIILFIVIGFFLFKSGSGIKVAVLKKIKTDEGFIIGEVHYNDPSYQGTRCVLDAVRVTLSKDKLLSSFDSFRLKLVPLNNPSIEIKGNKGVYDQNAKELNLRGNLQVSSDNGYSIYTEHITYSLKDGVLKSDEPVRIAGPFFSASGKGLLINPENNTYEIISDVTTLIESGNSNI
jgi:LPS export ABC transporter protein LptC